MRFTTVDEVLSAVLASGMHLVDSNDVEFSLAVHCHAYPNSVLAVWVYMVVLSGRVK